MRTLYLDVCSGISGDMALSAMLKLGADSNALSDLLSCAVGSKITVGLENVIRCGLSCGKLKIDAENTQIDLTRVRDLRRIIVSTHTTETIKANAINTLTILAEAAAGLQDVPVEDLHFSSIGGIDTFAACLGFAWCKEQLNIGKILSTRPLLGHGFTHTPKGILPLPAPITLKILNGIPVKTIDKEGEFTTPTGAAILKNYVSSFSGTFYGTIDKDCIAAGSKEYDGMPNFIRAVLFKDDTASNKDEVLLMKTNIDDMSGENFGFLLNALMETGALDVSYSPSYGKKNRPSYMLTVIAPRNTEKDFAKVIFRYSTTAGIRVQIVDRLVMGREMLTVNVEGQPVKVKRLYYDDIEKFCPEWDDCVKVSKKIITTPTDVHCRATFLASEKR